MKKPQMRESSPNRHMYDTVLASVAPKTFWEREWKHTKIHMSSAKQFLIEIAA